MNEPSGRCYCGTVRFTVQGAPQVVTYCHCVDCRRAHGAPVVTFAAFDADKVRMVAGSLRSISVTDGVERSFCGTCGSPVSGRYDYLPGQVYLAVGLFDRPEKLPPSVHAHHDSRIEWLSLSDDLEREGASARDVLR